MDSKDIKEVKKKKKENIYTPPERVIIDTTIGIEPFAHLAIELKYKPLVQLLWTFGGCMMKSQFIELSDMAETTIREWIADMEKYSIVKQIDRGIHPPLISLAKNGFIYCTKNRNYASKNAPQNDTIKKNIYIADYWKKYYKNNYLESLIGMGKQDRVAEIYNLQSYNIGREVLAEIEATESEIEGHKKIIKHCKKAIQQEKTDKNYNQILENSKLKIDRLQREILNKKTFKALMEKQQKLAFSREDMFTKLEKSHVFLDSFDGKTLKFVILDMERNQTWLFHMIKRIDTLIHNINRHLRVTNFKDVENDITLWNYEVLLLTESPERAEVMKEYAKTLYKEFSEYRGYYEAFTTTYEDMEKDNWKEIEKEKKEKRRKPGAYKGKKIILKRAALYLADIKTDWVNVNRFYRNKSKDESFLKLKDKEEVEPLLKIIMENTIEENKAL